jgi:hypothetical protein
MRANRQNFDVDQGSNWSYAFTFKDDAGSVVNLTGYTARMSLKRDLLSTESAYLTTGSDAFGGAISLGGALGTVTISMTAAQTTDLDKQIGLRAFTSDEDDYCPTVEFIYDLELISGAGVVQKVLYGFFVLRRAVTVNR